MLKVGPHTSRSVFGARYLPRLTAHISFLLSCLCCLSTIAVTPSNGVAQRRRGLSEKVLAETLFQRGLSLMGEKRYEAACDHLRQSMDIEPAIGTMLYLADCYERIGRTASAWALFAEASSTSRAEGQLDRAALAKERAAALRERLCKIAILLGDTKETPGLQVRTDGVLASAATWDLALPVDPGPHQVEISAPGFEPFRAEVRVTPPCETVTTLRVPALKQKPAAPQVAVAQAAPVAGPPAAGDDPSAAASPAKGPHRTVSKRTSVGRDTGTHWSRIAAISMTGVGLLATAVGAGFGARAYALDAQADRECGSSAGNCASLSGFEAAKDAQQAANLATGLVVAGVATAAFGTLWYFLTPDRGESSGLSFVVGPTGAQLGGQL